MVRGKMNSVRKWFLIIAGIVFLSGGSWLGYLYHQDYTNLDEPWDGRKIYFLKDSDFSSGNWTLKCVDYPNTTYLYLNDNEILNEYKSKMVISQESDAYYTTPNYMVFLFKDGIQVEGCPLNHFDRVNFDGLEKYLITVKCRTLETYSKNEYMDILSELKNKKEVMNINPEVEQTYKEVFEITIIFKEDIDDWDTFKKELAKTINESYGIPNRVFDCFMKPYSTNHKYGIGIVIPIGFYDIEKFDLENLRNLDVLRDKKVLNITKQKNLDRYIIKYDEIVPK